MKTPTTPPTPITPDILHLLDYCRLDRAAELLGCTAEDLFHLGDTGKIGLYWHFEEQLAHTNRRLITWERVKEDWELWAGDGDAIDVDAKTYVYACNEDAFIEAYERVDNEEDIPIWLFGLWDATSLLVKRLESPRQRDPHFWVRTPKLEVILPAGWQPPPYQALCIKHNDLMRLRNAIAHGEPLTPSPREQAQEGELDTRRIRESTKPYHALVELLTAAAGFKSDDFRGSINAMQTKLANKNMGGTLTSISEKTLADWLKKGGVR